MENLVFEIITNFEIGIPRDINNVLLSYLDPVDKFFLRQTSKLIYFKTGKQVEYIPDRRELRGISYLDFAAKHGNETAFNRWCEAGKEISSDTICLAAKNGNVSILEKILKRSDFPSKPNAFMKALKHGNFECMKKLCNEIQIDESVVLIAAKKGFEKCLEFLLGLFDTIHGSIIDVLACSHARCSPVLTKHVKEKGYHLNSVVDIAAVVIGKHDDLCNWLQSREPSWIFEEIRGKSSRDALDFFVKYVMMSQLVYWASKRKDKEMMISLLPYFEGRSRFSQIAFGLFCKIGDKKKVKDMIEKDKVSLTKRAMRYSIKYGHFDCALLILQHRKQFDASTLSLIEKTRRYDILEIITKAHGHDMFPDTDNPVVEVKRGNIENLKHFRGYKPSLHVHALAYRQFKIAEFLVERGYHKKSSMYSEFLKKGRAAIVEYMVKNGYPLPDNAEKLAIKNGHPKCLIAVMRGRKPEFKNESACFYSVTRGDCESLRILLDNGYPAKSDEMKVAVQRWYKDCIDLLLERGVEKNENAILDLIKENNYSEDRAKFLFDNGFPHTKDLVSHAALISVKAVEIALRHGFEKHEKSCENAVYTHETDVLEFLIENGFPKSELALKAAVESKNYAAFMLLFRNNFPGIDKAKEYAENHDCLIYLSMIKTMIKSKKKKTEKE